MQSKYHFKEVKFATPVSRSNDGGSVANNHTHIDTLSSRYAHPLPITHTAGCEFHYNELFCIEHLSHREEYSSSSLTNLCKFFKVWFWQRNQCRLELNLNIGLSFLNLTMNTTWAKISSKNRSTRISLRILGMLLDLYFNSATHYFLFL